MPEEAGAQETALTVDTVRNWLSANKGNEDVSSFLGEIAPETELTAEVVSPFLETETGKSLVQPLIDKAVTTGIKTYEQGHFNEKVKAEVAKKLLELNPEETPEAKQIRELREEIMNEKKLREKDTLRRSIVEETAKQGVDSWWVDEFAGNTIEEAKVFIAKIKAHDAKLVEKTRNELLAAGFKPGSGSGNGQGKKVDLKSLSIAEAIRMEQEGELDEALAE